MLLIFMVFGIAGCATTGGVEKENAGVRNPLAWTVPKGAVVELGVAGDPGLAYRLKVQDTRLQGIIPVLEAGETYRMDLGREQEIYLAGFYATPEATNDWRPFGAGAIACVDGCADRANFAVEFRVDGGHAMRVTVVSTQALVPRALALKR